MENCNGYLTVVSDLPIKAMNEQLYSYVSTGRLANVYFIPNDVMDR